MTVTENGLTIEAPDGHRIEAFQWIGEKPVRGIVQIVHGMAEHSRRYRHVAQALVQAGYLVYASEHRGHGQSALDNGTLGDFGAKGFNALVDDMVTVSRHLRERHSSLPLLMLAHSMGSFAAQIFLLDYAELVDAIALSGTTALELLDPRHSGWTLEAANAAIAEPLTVVDWLSRDPAVPAAYVADTLSGFALTEVSLLSIFDHGRRTSDMAQFDKVRKELPLYLFTGDQDSVNRYLAWFDPLVERLRLAGFRDLSTHVYGGARHEVLNETNRDEVISNLIAWLNRVTG
ncbi:lysophospholipase [Paraburkholderia sp. CNPSo 3272]|uniref:alpha/beta fold hydrolase n=1 Tax=Paraburkholderia sp. CNPSo 3272 TaxID=2940931 RepID=UPI0020B7D068|nr:alpha/beta fold hydrolase [Paraburkholderia sp. CNPSo 3272]MCP3728478.1 lysophospholipase [Paraburkholderia sp. CNPSo 3272]